jgi:cysteine synthase
MDALSAASAVHRPGRGRVFDSIVDAVGDTPIVRLRKLPQAHGLQATILAKLEYFNPAASVKDRIGAAMIIAMEKVGVINADTVLIEPTSGNTGIALAFVAASRGYRLKLVMPESMSIERRKMLAFLGAEIVLTPAAQGMKGSIAAAEELVRTTPRIWPIPKFIAAPRRRKSGTIPAATSMSSWPASAPAAPSPGSGRC